MSRRSSATAAAFLLGGAAFCAGALGACGGGGGATTTQGLPHTTASSVSAGGSSGEGGLGEGGAGGEGGVGGQGGTATPNPGCGDGKIVFPEECDGANLMGTNCESFGFSGGTLACDPVTCRYDVTKCTMPEDCFNGLDDDKDGKTDCDDPDCANVCVSSCAPGSVIVLHQDSVTVSGNTTGHANLLNASCSAMNGTQSGPEIVYQTTADFTGVLEVVLEQDAPLDFDVSVRTQCAMQGSELACDDSGKSQGMNDLLRLPITKGATVFIVVQGNASGASGNYTLTVSNRAPLCGDGATDPPEECDDGGTTSGDGCSAQCKVEATELEPNDTAANATAYVAPFYGVIAPAGDTDLIKVDVPPSASSLTATIDAFDSGCTTAWLDSALDLYDKDGTTLLGSNDDGVAHGTCSTLQMSGLVPGTYFVRVSASMKAAAPTFGYKLTVTTN